MKTAILTAPGRIEIRESAVPEIRNEDDVLLRTALVGICGSDLHYFSEPRVGDLGLMATHTFPFGRVQEAFDTVFDHRDGVIKAMISIEG